MAHVQALRSINMSSYFFVSMLFPSNLITQVKSLPGSVKEETQLFQVGQLP